MRRRMRRSLTLLVFACVGVWAQNNSATDAGPARVEAPKVSPGAPDPNATGLAVDPNAYVIGVLDQILIKVFRDNDFTGVYMVRPDGKITLPLIGEMQAAGLTLEALG